VNGKPGITIGSATATKQDLETLTDAVGKDSTATASGEGNRAISTGESADS